MASGYDRRAPTRDSFAMQPVAPVQAQTGSHSGASRGAQLVGGRSIGGVVTAGRQTDAPNVAAGLGQYVEDFMRPHVERVQQQKFYEGMAAAQEGAALEELSRSHRGIGKIFGPTAFEQGAQFYAARKAVEDFVQEQTADLDTLKRLPPKEMARVLSEKGRALMTGDPGADQLIQADLIKSTGPLMQLHAKHRYAWQQTEAANQFSLAGASAGSALQRTAVAAAQIADPSDEDNATIVGAVHNFRQGMVKPEGMDDDTYVKSLAKTVEGMMQRGDFYSVSALKGAGFYDVLTEDQRVKLENAEQRYSDRTIGKFMTDDAEVSKMLVEYEGKRAVGGMSALEAQAELARINAYVRLHTGVEEDVFDWKASKGEVRSIAEMAESSRQRAESRAWQLEDRQFAADQRAAERAADLAETTAAVGAAWASGDVNGAMAAGLPPASFNQVALTEYRNGNLTGLTRAFTSGRYVAPSVRNDIQASVERGLDQQYGKATQEAHQKWRAMNEANPGMAAAYYGDYHAKMQAFDTAARQVGPERAYTTAFGDTARYSNRSIRPDSRRAASEAITKHVEGMQPAWYNPWGQKIGDDAAAVIRNVATEGVALAMQNSDTPPDSLVAEVVAARLADGSLQMAGGKAWRAAPGTPSFAAQLGLQQAEADALFTRVVDGRLKAVGFKEGVNGHLEINYVRAPNGSNMMHVIARHEGEQRQATISMDSFKAAHREGLTPKRNSGGLNELRARGFDPNRRVHVTTGEPIPQNWRSLPVTHPQFLR